MAEFSVSRKLSRGFGGAVLVATLGLPATPYAQDAHYWPLQVGSRATMLGGTVVALDRDLSASFYNPGSLARSVGGDALSMFAKTSTGLTLGLGTTPALTATSSIGASAPGMFAAVIPGLHLVENDVVTFSYLVRQSSKLDMSGSVLSSPTLPAEAIELSVFQDINDGWYGLSWGRDVDGWGVGVSLFFSSVSYRQRIEAKDIAIRSPAEAGSLAENVYYSLACRRLIAKGGATWSSGPVSLGATVSLPSLGLPWSSGTFSAGRNFVYADTTLTAQIGSSRQEDLDASYREPLSIALGAQATVGSFEFHASAEWFAPVDEYDVLETRPIESQVPPESFELQLTQQRIDVFNVGAGVSIHAASWLSFFGSVRTDRSYRDPEAERVFVGLGGYDLVHATAGLGLSGDHLDVVLGGLFSSGEGDGTLTLSPLPSSPSVSTRTEFSQTGFIMAFSARF